MTMSAMTTEVNARPIRTPRMAWIAAVVVAIALIICGILLPHTTNGVNFDLADQIGIAGSGIIVAIGILALTRPRLHADADGVDVKAFFGGWRHIDWDLIVAVEFPSKVRFARLVLPGEELIVLFAVQRADGEQSVQAMQGLRALFAASRPE